MLYTIINNRLPDYLNYIRAQKRPSELKALAKERDLKLLERKSSKHFISLDYPRRSVFYNKTDMIQVPSPIMDTDIKPIPASQTPSQVLPYVQSKLLVS